MEEKKHLFLNEKNETIITNMIRKNVLSNEIKNTMKYLSDVLSKSLGPYGQNTMIVSPSSGGHVFTKDGKRILYSLAFEHPIARMILDNIRQNAFNIADKVGDGTTTSVITTHSILDELYKVLANIDIPSISVTNYLNSVKDFVVNYLTTKSRKVTDIETIKNIATISSNNDKSIGELISDIYKTLGFNVIINPIRTYDAVTYVEETLGYEHDRGYILPEFINNSSTDTFKAKTVKVFAIDDDFTKDDIEFLKLLIETAITPDKSNPGSVLPLVIIARGFDETVKTWIRKSKQGAAYLPICMVDTAIGTQASFERFDDLCTYIGVEPIRRRATLDDLPNKMEIVRALTCEEKSFIGKISSFEAYRDKTIFGKSVFKEANAATRKRINKLKAGVKRQEERALEHHVAIANLNARIANLESKVANLYIGGETEAEIQAKYDLIEDAVLAVRSAIKSGYNQGGSIQIANALIELYVNTLDTDVNEKAILRALMTASLYPFKCVLANAGIKDVEIDNILKQMSITGTMYNLVTRKYEPIESTTVINPTSTDIEVFKMAISISGLLLTSNQISTTMYYEDNINK